MARNKKAGLVYGWGVNDVDYNVTRSKVIDGKKKCVWICPYYSKWAGILERCLCPKWKEKYPTYRDCTITDEWKCLSDFIKWVDSQPNRDWQNCEPDKDLLSEGNKHYSPETVLFVTKQVNNFITDSGKSRGKYMIGVCDYSKYRKNTTYQSVCNNLFTGKLKTLGYYTTEIEAHLAWQAYKHEMACLLADQQSDLRVAEALRQRYAPDKDWTNR